MGGSRWRTEEGCDGIFDDFVLLIITERLEQAFHRRDFLQEQPKRKCLLANGGFGATGFCARPLY